MYSMPSKTTYTLALAQSPLSAGPGTFASADFDELDVNLLLSAGQPEHCFIYPVTGDSCDPQIPHGSLVVVNRKIEPMDGHTVAVSLDGLNHIKILERTRLRLVSPNTDYEPLQIRDPFHVIGVVTWCMRPITKSKQLPEPVYVMTDVKAHGPILRAKFQADCGHTLELNFKKDAAEEGMEMTAQVL